MPDLKNKTILILSPQAWGKMFISKHHYAIELAKRGNTVYFLNPPDQQKTERKEAIEIRPSDIHTNLFLIEHKLFFPYLLKFKAISVFHWLMRFHIRRLVRKIRKPMDIIWSFDLGNLYPLDCFDNKSYKIFHPVDEPLNKEAINAAKGANIIFSVTHEILEKYKEYQVPRHFINHGVTEDFIAPTIDYVPNNPPRVGFSGNLLRPDIDREILLQIIDKNPNVHFSIWGSYSQRDTNVGGTENQSTQEFIQQLKKRSNVKLHGPVSSKELAKAIQAMDAFLICYDIKKDQSRGTNYHKVIEYIASGKVVVSNNITTYKDKPDLIQMIKNRDSNSELVELVKEVINNLPFHNSPKQMQHRISFAKANRYEQQLERIENLILN